jgi:methyl-accepting chemotaxis protein
MTEDRKRDLQNFIAAGKKVVAKLKKYHDDKIISYDGEDAFYSDADEYAEDIDDAIEDAYEGNAPAEEKSFSYYEKIMNKLDTVKDSIKGNEGVSEILKKAENLFKSNVLTKEQLQTELDELMVELDDKLSALSDKSTQITGSIDNLTEQSKSNYSNISASISEVSDKTDDMISTLAEVNAVLKSSAPKLDQ